MQKTQRTEHCGREKIMKKTPYSHNSIVCIPVFLCEDFMIYDSSCTDLAAAEHFTDFSDDVKIFVINFEDDF